MTLSWGFLFVLINLEILGPIDVIMSTFEEIEKEFQDLVYQQRHSDDISSYTTALMLMAGIIIVSLLVLFIMVGYNTKMLLIVLVILIMFTLYRLRMNKAAEVVAAAQTDAVSSLEIDKETMTQKLKYLIAGIDLKINRVKSVRQFYIFIFPLFLICIKEILHGPQSNRFLFWALLSSIVVSAVVWTRFFRRDIRELEETKEITLQLKKAVDSQ